ncbi:hypothetical protein GQ54DRAFT_145015 [Martensiomyces pterosporus]|nr:hypothetical protein GQ54DRAFT_145015 [Martensiomyces pterosporus]
MLAFDPVTSEADVQTYKGFGIAIIDENEEAKRRASKRTLFYMPHCEQFLYNNLVETNFSGEALTRVMVIGNHFSGYRESQGNEEFSRRSPHIRRILAHLAKVELPSEKLLALRHSPYAFNDTCVQYVEQASVGSIDFTPV